MPDKLAKFLIDLSENPAKRLKFDADPHAMMDAAGLSAADQELVLSRDPARIRGRYGMETVAHMTRIPSGLRKAGPTPEAAPSKDSSKKPAKKKKKVAKKKSK
jgi:hypothetical protein